MNFQKSFPTKFLPTIAKHKSFYQKFQRFFSVSFLVQKKLSAFIETFI